MHELRVGQVVLACCRVDPRDPQPPEVALAIAPIAIPVLVRLEHRFLGRAVMPAGIAAVALGQRECRPSLLARMNAALDPGHPRPLRLAPSSVITRSRSSSEIQTGRD